MAAESTVTHHSHLMPVKTNLAKERYPVDGNVLLDPFWSIHLFPPLGENDAEPPRLILTDPLPETASHQIQRMITRHRVKTPSPSTWKRYGEERILSL